MGRMFRLCNITLLLMLSAYPTLAAEPLIPINFKGIYDINLGEVRFARMGLEIEQDSDHYAITGDIASTGIVKLFANHKSHTTVDASGKQFFYPVRVYESNYSTRKKKKYVKLEYNNGSAVKETLVPPENRAKRPEVSQQLKKGSYDPLSFIVAMRQQVAKALASGKNDFVIDAYDGRRLNRAHFTMGEKKTLRLNDKKIPVIAVSVKRELVAGFTDSELEDYDKNEPPLTVYFSNDERLIPIRLETSFWLGTLSATLAKECRTGESCLLGIKP